MSDDIFAFPENSLSLVGKAGPQSGKQKPTPTFERPARNSNLVFLPDLHSLNLLKSQLVPGSIIYPGGRRTGMAGDPLRDLNCAA